eukprot:m.11482 g.11482  ORF g.11482 m.11482 type:complete len:123 (+) comp5732_c0_seq1:259-627(+)
MSALFGRTLVRCARLPAQLRRVSAVQTPIVSQMLRMSTTANGDVSDRILSILNAFPAISDQTNVVTLKSNFLNDFGLDSLDIVEVAMAVEDEFGIEIPDEEATKIRTGEDAVKVVSEILAKQ